MCSSDLKRGYWRDIDSAAGMSTPETATGLQGRVRFLEAPHTEENYLLHEMGFRIARKHRAKLRRIAVVLAFAVPAALVLVSLLGGVLAIAASVLAALSATLGVLVERWLFFAEARHTVTLYYGAEAA